MKEKPVKKSHSIVAAVLLACGCSGGGGGGGSSIQVQVFEDGPGAAVAGATVMRHDADGNLLEVVTADASGRATISAAPMISAGWVEGGTNHWGETWIDPDPGDA